MCIAGHSLGRELARLVHQNYSSKKVRGPVSKLEGWAIDRGGYRSEFAQTVPNRKVFFAPYLVNGRPFREQENDESA